MSVRIRDGNIKATPENFARTLQEATEVLNGNHDGPVDAVIIIAFTEDGIRQIIGNNGELVDGKREMFGHIANEVNKTVKDATTPDIEQLKAMIAAMGEDEDGDECASCGDEDCPDNPATRARDSLEAMFR
ncbi:unnamed protein product [marine sediment metagenome]|uniref:Uncharacterized protein n=1 Tax=marine sediment metagenome TaxID=412755 RepID=X0Z5N6_9ZZZZ